ncbi:MAG: hypothetical protein WBN42_07685 [Ignavibacteriaceae bacterium]
MQDLGDNFNVKDFPAHARMDKYSFKSYNIFQSGPTINKLDVHFDK